MILAKLFPDPLRPVTVDPLADVSCKYYYNKTLSFSPASHRPRTKARKAQLRTGLAKLCAIRALVWFASSRSDGAASPRRSKQIPKQLRSSVSELINDAIFEDPLFGRHGTWENQR